MFNLFLEIVVCVCVCRRQKLLKIMFEIHKRHGFFYQKFNRFHQTCCHGNWRLLPQLPSPKRIGVIRGLLRKLVLLNSHDVGAGASPNFEKPQFWKDQTARAACASWFRSWTCLPNRKNERIRQFVVFVWSLLNPAPHHDWDSRQGPLAPHPEAVTWNHGVPVG